MKKFRNLFYLFAVTLIIGILFVFEINIYPNSATVNNLQQLEGISEIYDTGYEPEYQYEDSGPDYVSSLSEQTYIYQETSSCDIATSCWVYYNRGEREDGIYTIRPGDYELTVYCDMTNGGWTIIDPYRDPNWGYYFNGWASYAGGLVYGVGNSRLSWREWFRLSTPTMEFATSPSGQTIESKNTIYRMTGNYYGCYWFNRSCDFDGTCHECRDGYNTFDTPGTCPWLVHEGWDGPDDAYRHSCSGDWWNNAPSIGANGTHCVAYIDPTEPVFCIEVISSGETIDGNDSERFKLQIVPDTIGGQEVEPSAYQWYGDEVARDGLGNTQDINFKTPSQRTTTIENAHWFASPDNRLAEVTGNDCHYTVNCDVTINGDTYNDTTPPTWRVYLPEPEGATEWPNIVGMTRVSLRRVNSQRQWYISDIGDLTRTAPIDHVYLPETSQFYNKVNIHEKRHVTQWTSMDPWQNLFNATALYNNVLVNLTSNVSRQDLEQQVQSAIEKQRNDDRIIAGKPAAVTDRERDAYNVSNAVLPDYLEVDIP